MNFTLYQIITPIISCLAIMYVWSLTLRGLKRTWSAVLWSFFWVCLTLLAWRPAFIDSLMIFTGVRDRVNAIFVTGIGILFLLVFYVITRLEIIQRKQYKLVQKIALQKFKDEYIHTAS
jgi:hypothetical protein